MKTYEQLMTHYWGVIVPMAESEGINPWECVRYHKLVMFTDHPDFKDGNYDGFEFALTVLEKTPLFKGDTVYSNAPGSPVKMFINETTVTYCNPVQWKITPPTKKRTFAVELTESELEKLIYCTYSDLHIKLCAARDKE